jgi:predicted ArsR family transcriptional regulator
MSGPATGDAQWETLQLLTEPTRRGIYDAVRASRHPMTREEVATAAGVSKSLAAFHLDLLAERGLLAVDYARPPGRSGPGAGRPAKRYRAVTVEVDVSVPPRRYDVAARVLARAVAEAGSAPAGDRAMEVAREEGERLGRLRRSARRMSADRSLDVAAQTLTDLGYEPEREGSCVRLRNCPFHAIVDVAPALVCGLNDALIDGILEGLGSSGVSAALDGVPPDCCVTVARR